MGRKLETSDASIEFYFREISKYPPLSTEEEKEIIEKVKKGDKLALEKLILSNLRFVVEIASRYRDMGVPFEDLINEGNIGLIKAVKHFNPEKGVKFLSYAIWWIKQSIMKMLDEYDLIRKPTERKAKVRKVRKAEKEYLQKHGKLPSPKELSKITGISEKEVEESYEIFQKELSLDRPLKESEKTSWEELLSQKALPSPEEYFRKEYVKEKIKSALKELDKKEQKIISLYYGLEDDIPRTLEQIGKEIGISRERVRQIKERALTKLRKKLNKNLLRNL